MLILYYSPVEELGAEVSSGDVEGELVASVGFTEC